MKYIKLPDSLKKTEITEKMHRLYHGKNKKILVWVGSIVVTMVLGTVALGIVLVGKQEATPIEADKNQTAVESTAVILTDAKVASEDGMTQDIATEAKDGDGTVRNTDITTGVRAAGVLAADVVQEEENEYANLAIADVTNYVNVRSVPGTEGEILGKIYDGAVAQILETVSPEGEDWFKVVSGKLEGYIKAEFFIFGQAAADVIDQYVTRYVQVQADRLNVRKEASPEAGRIGYLDQGEKAILLENQGEWMQIKYGNGKTGYVAAEYVTVVEEFKYAISIEEERAERLLALQQRENNKEQNAPENLTAVQPPNTDYSSNQELRDQIVEYAMQFLGNKYIHGGNSLTEGTDCSGFTSLIYGQFGYSVGRTPASQLSSAGRGIDYSEIQKGDIICYGSSGKCTHVALYIGGGQIIHEANSKKGVVIYQADYDTILGVKNIID